MSYVYLGHWKWVEGTTGPCWQPPDGCEWALDMRSIPQMSKVGGEPEGYGVFSLAKEDPDAGDLLEKATVQSVLGKTVQSEKPEDIAWELLVDHGDPTGQSFAKPLMPNSRLEMKLILGQTVKTETFDPVRHLLVIPTIQNDYRRIRNECLAVQSNHYLKVMGALERKYGLSSYNFIPEDLPKEKPLKPSTTIGDTFVEASDNSLDNHTATGPNGGFSWTHVIGSFQIKGTSDDVDSTGSATHNNARAEQALSSDDHYSQALAWVPDGTSRDIGTIVRFASGADTGYIGLYDPGNDRFSIYKVVEGSYTSLGAYNESLGALTGGLFKVEADGNTITLTYASAQKVQVIDTSITGNLDTGIRAYNTYSTLDNFEAADLSGTEAKTSADTGAGADVVAAAEVAIGGSEAGSGAESLGARSFSVPDTGSAVEEVKGRALVAGDTGQAASEYAHILGLWEVLFGVDNGLGSDSLRMLTVKKGHDIKFRPDLGRVGLPHKEVNL